MPSEAGPTEDTRVWMGRLASGREADHARFVEWLSGPEAHSIFLRRRLTEYQLIEDDRRLTIVFKAPHTGDPRLMIDVLRFPGLWPEFWEFERAGEVADATMSGKTTVHWRRPV